jgi:hypothetical protein
MKYNWFLIISLQKIDSKGNERYYRPVGDGFC